MSDNPYEPSAASFEAVGVRSGKREDVVSVAKYQKGILVCILLYFIAFSLRMAAPGVLGGPQIGAVVIGLIGLMGAIFTILLAMRVYNMALGILIGILALVPVLGLLVLLLINARATKVLTDNGIKVGLMGAKLSEL